MTLRRTAALLIVSVREVDAQSLAVELQGFGWARTRAVACELLVSEVVRLAPDAVIAFAPGPVEPALVSALQALRDAAPRPVLLVTPRLPRDLVAALPAAGVHEWRLSPGGADDWSLWLALASARFAHERAQHDALAEARAQLDERKWIDRAKGVLMRAQTLDEQQAFVLLREASMHANLRLAEVSRGVIEAARAAGAINRAGQLRMLSQRIVKALALRAAGVGGTEALTADSRARLYVNLDHLDAVARDTAPQALHQARAAADALDALLADGGGLDEADARAEALLAAADALTGAIEQKLGRGPLRVVNVCGRQRMLSQRLAKQALLALRPGAPAAASALVRTRAAFDAGLAELDATPLSTEAIRAELALARGRWSRLLDAAARGALPAIALESEALLAGFEELTSLYERSLQVLLG